MPEKDFIKGLKKQTDNKFLNMYAADAVDHNGEGFEYYFATRREEGDLMCQTGELKADGVAIYAVLKDEPDKLIMVRQYRYPINDFIYELPAGLVDRGETAREAALRELKEETGYELELFTDYPEYLDRPYIQSQGMSDECDIFVYGFAEGTPSVDGNEATEEIEVKVVDKEEAKRILREEKVTVRAYTMLINFINSVPENPFGFLRMEDK